MSPVQSFSPSAMSAEVLERIFVKRHDLIERLHAQVVEHVGGQSASNALLIGPRGIGKTHLVSMLWHRVRADDACANVRLAWLKEDEWGVASFVDLVVRMLRALRPRDDALLAPLEEDPTAETAMRLLEETVGSDRVVFLIENIDRLLDEIGTDGQHALRAFAENFPNAMFVATSTTVPQAISTRRKPLFGFFERTRLEPLTFEEACELLEKLARHHGDESLARFIESPTGRARVRAVDHLAGGSPRVYVVLSEFLTEEALEQLVDSFLEALDRLTPYYQAKMEAVSAQQRKIIECLVDRGGRVRVAEIAKKCLLSPQVASRQLKSLKDAGLVAVQTRGRNSLYEIAEPLMGMCLAVKNQRAGSVELVVEIVKLWFGRAELLRLVESEDTLTAEFREQLLGAINSSRPSPVADLASASVRVAFKSDDLPRALANAEELVRIRGAAIDHIVLATAHLANGQIYDLLDALGRSYVDPNWPNRYQPLGHPAESAICAFVLLAGGRQDAARELLELVYERAEGAVRRFVEIGLVSMGSSLGPESSRLTQCPFGVSVSIDREWFSALLRTEALDGIRRWGTVAHPFLSVISIAYRHVRGESISDALHRAMTRLKSSESPASIGTVLLLERFAMIKFQGFDNPRTVSWLELDESLRSKYPDEVAPREVVNALDSYARTGEEQYLDALPETIRAVMAADDFQGFLRTFAVN